MNTPIVVLGLGHIGQFVVEALTKTTVYTHPVIGYDLRDGYDLTNPATIAQCVKHAAVVIDTLPYQCNRGILSYAALLDIPYFNLTEDVSIIDAAKAASSKAPIVPQCGLAPGMVSIIAARLSTEFDAVHSIKVRVGALPQAALNHLKYALTWNTAGLVNEYCNPCWVIDDQRLQQVPPLGGQETLRVFDADYEAAYTSGGIGTLAETCAQWSPVPHEVSYKTVRYPGHFDAVRVWRDDLRMGAKKDAMVSWLDETIPHTADDVVVIVIEVVGMIRGVLTSRMYSHRIWSTPHTTAIQAATGYGLLAVVDAYLRGRLTTGGYVTQESLDYSAIASSHFAAAFNLPLVGVLGHTHG